ncbi:MAG: hypothetical protein U0744_13785, partial [Gemmataceae bacterium]
RGPDAVLTPLLPSEKRAASAALPFSPKETPQSNLYQDIAMISQAIVESKPGKKLIRYFPRPELSGPYYELSLGIDSQALYYIDPSKPQKTAILQPHVEWQQESLRRDIVEHFIRSGLDMHSETNDLADAILEALKRGPAPCTSVDTALSRLATGARYTSPNRVMFQQCDGPYRRLHLFDQVLGRDVAYCEEYHHFAETAWSRSKFLKEAQIGALRHPCLVPVLDFGQTKDGRFYFTQPLLLGESLASVVDDCLSNEGRRILYSGLKEAALPPMGMEDRESWENACLERRRRLEQQGFARWVERPAARRPRLGCHADVKAIYSELEECISKFG